MRTRRAPYLLLSVLAILAAGTMGCNDSPSAPRDVTPPSAPRAVYSVTGDHEVFLHWLDNPEPDVAGYHVYIASCLDGPDCPYDRIGTTAAPEFAVSGLANGVTRFYAVTAYDRSGNESELSYENVFDTPRPEGFGVRLADAATEPALSGWDFSEYRIRAFDDPALDIYFIRSEGVDLLVAPFTDTDIQDAGFATSLDDIDFAPNGGWSPSGTVELIPGHCYVVWTHDNHFAKLRLTGIGDGVMVMDWAYQVDPGNRELAARRAPATGERERRSGLP
jgi:hypothetical protein